MPERSFDPDERVGLPDDDPIEVVRELLEVESDEEQEPEQGGAGAREAAGRG
jgi:hypothetical protein